VNEWTPGPPTEAGWWWLKVPTREELLLIQRDAAGRMWTHGGNLLPPALLDDHPLWKDCSHRYAEPPR